MFEEIDVDLFVDEEEADIIIDDMLLSLEVDDLIKEIAGEDPNFFAELQEMTCEE